MTTAKELTYDEAIASTKPPKAPPTSSPSGVASASPSLEASIKPIPLESVKGLIGSLGLVTEVGHDYYCTRNNPIDTDPFNRSRRFDLYKMSKEELGVWRLLTRDIIPPYTVPITSTYSWIPPNSIYQSNIMVQGPYFAGTVEYRSAIQNNDISYYYFTFDESSDYNSSINRKVYRTTDLTQPATLISSGNMYPDFNKCICLGEGRIAFQKNIFNYFGNLVDVSNLDWMLYPCHFDPKILKSTGAGKEKEDTLIGIAHMPILCNRVIEGAKTGDTSSQGNTIDINYFMPGNTGLPNPKVWNGTIYDGSYISLSGNITLGDARYDVYSTKVVDYAVLGTNAQYYIPRPKENSLIAFNGVTGYSGYPLLGRTEIVGSGPIINSITRYARDFNINWDSVEQKGYCQIAGAITDIYHVDGGPFFNKGYLDNVYNPVESHTWIDGQYETNFDEDVRWYPIVDKVVWKIVNGSMYSFIYFSNPQNELGIHLNYVASIAAFYSTDLSATETLYTQVAAAIKTGVHNNIFLANASASTQMVPLSNLYTPTGLDTYGWARFTIFAELVVSTNITSATKGIVQSFTSIIDSTFANVNCPGLPLVESIEYIGVTGDSGNLVFGLRRLGNSSSRLWVYSTDYGKTFTDATNPASQPINSAATCISVRSGKNSAIIVEADSPAIDISTIDRWNPNTTINYRTRQSMIPLNSGVTHTKFYMTADGGNNWSLGGELLTYHVRRGYLAKYYNPCTVIGDNTVIYLEGTYTISTDPIPAVTEICKRVFENNAAIANKNRTYYRTSKPINTVTKIEFQGQLKDEQGEEIWNEIAITKYPPIEAQKDSNFPDRVYVNVTSYPIDVPTFAISARITYIPEIPVESMSYADPIYDVDDGVVVVGIPHICKKVFTSDKIDLSPLPQEWAMGSSIENSTLYSHQSFAVLVDPASLSWNKPYLTTETTVYPLIAYRDSTHITMVRTVAYALGVFSYGGVSPYSWATVSTLPPGLEFTTSGVFQGTPVLSGEWSITCTVTDGSTPPLTSSVTITITVS